MNNDIREFHIGDVYTVATGKLVAPRHIEAVYDLCGYMTNSSPMTHQLPRLSRECEPSLREQFPELTAEPMSLISSREEADAWLATLYPKYGETVAVATANRCDTLTHMADTKAAKANTQETASEQQAAAEAARAKTASKSAAEAEKLPSASAPAVASEAEATKSETTLTAGEADKIASDASEGEFGPFKDTARPVGAALDATVEPKEINTDLDFADGTAFTETAGDTFVAVRQQNARNVVEVGILGWNGPGFVFAPYQAKLLHKALGKVVGKLK